MLEVDVVCAEDLLHLRVDERCLTCMTFFLLPLGYLFDADIDHVCRRHPDIRPLVFERIKYASVVVLNAKKLIECDDRLFLA